MHVYNLRISNPLLVLPLLLLVLLLLLFVLLALLGTLLLLLLPVLAISSQLASSSTLGRVALGLLLPNLDIDIEPPDRSPNSRINLVGQLAAIETLVY